MNVKCGGCGLVTFSADGTCRRCGAPLAGTVAPVGPAPAPTYAVGIPTAHAGNFSAAPLPPPAAPRRSMALGIVVLIVLGAIITAVVFFTRGHAVVTPHWQPYTAPDGRMTASFPSYPIEANQDDLRSKGIATESNLPWHAYEADLGPLGLVMVRYYDLTPLIAKYGSITAPQREKIMIALEKHLASETSHGMQFHLEDKEWIEVQGGQGVAAHGTFELKIDSHTSNGLMALQTFWGPPDRIYTVIVAGPAGGEIYESRETVFQSVHISGPQ